MFHREGLWRRVRLSLDRLGRISVSMSLTRPLIFFVSFLIYQIDCSQDVLLCLVAKMKIGEMIFDRRSAGETASSGSSMEKLEE